MGHAVDYITVDKRSEIMEVASEFAFFNTDRGENRSGSYHGNMTIHDTPVCESLEEAKQRIDAWDTGWYSDHAVQYKDKSSLQPTKAMIALSERSDKLITDRKAYIAEHSLKNRKSAYIGCKNCGSKLSVEHLRGTRCPLCGKELRADYIIERIRKYDKDIEDTHTQYAELRKKQTGKCPVRWLVKVEVHC